ncbi:hypothetical protein FOA52_004612 [Chlamydomonas sp. UWO 241]|nr:hypothetical protein FOA52_004612 [Chlamydomonas sp. UWO 241]
MGDPESEAPRAAEAAAAGPGRATPPGQAAALANMHARLRAQSTTQAAGSPGLPGPGGAAGVGGLAGLGGAAAMPGLQALLAAQQQQQQLGGHGGGAGGGMNAGMMAALSGLLQQQQAAAAAAAQLAPGPGPGQKVFDLMDIIGDTSRGVSVQQATHLQSAVRSLRDAGLAANMAALVSMSPEELQKLLVTQNINVKDVLFKLVKHIDPSKALKHFGPGYYYGPQVPQQPANPAAALLAMLQQAQGAGLQGLQMQAQGLPGMGQQLHGPADVLRGMVPGSVRHAVYEVLLSAGPRGMRTDEIYVTLAARGLTNAWGDAPTAKAAIQATCASEGGLCRLVDGAYAVRTLLPGGSLASMGSGQMQGAHHFIRPAAAAALAKPGPPRMRRAPPAFTRNNARCAACLRTYHLDFSPLCLCDFCPRAYHMACMGGSSAEGVDYRELSDKEWACPGCVGRHKATLARKPAPVRDVQKDALALGDMAPEWERLDRGAKRAWREAERVRRLAEEAESREHTWGNARDGHGTGAGQLGPGTHREATPDDEDDEEEDEVVEEDSGDEMPAKTAKSGRAARAAAAEAAAAVAAARFVGEEAMDGLSRGARVFSAEQLGWRERAARRGMFNAPPKADVEDAELAEEEAAEVWIQQELTVELKKRSVAGEQPRGAEAVAAAAAAKAATEANAPPAVLSLLRAAADMLCERPPPRRGPGQRAESAAEAATEAEARIARTRLVAAGPPRVASFTSDQAHVAAFLDAIAVAEFTHAFSRMLGLAPVSVAEVRHAAAHPGRTLERLYLCLLRYLLHLWSSYGGRTLPRIRRWSRLMERGAAWQEVLRRYLLMSRQGIQVDERELELPLHELSDESAAVVAAVELGKTAYHMLPAAMHMRVLALLCSDISEANAMRIEMQVRVDVQIELAAVKAQRDKEGAKARKEALLAATKSKSKSYFFARPGLPPQAPPAQLSGALSASGQLQSHASFGRSADMGLSTAASAGNDGAGGDSLGRADSLPGGYDDDREGSPDGGGFAIAGLGRPPGSGAGGTGTGKRKVAKPHPMAKNPKGVAARAKAAAAARDAADADELGGAGGEEAERRLHEAEQEARFVSLRYEPLGLDREYRRYWFMSSGCDALVVEDHESAGLGIVSSIPELEGLLASLNARGAREGPLAAALARVAPRVAAWLARREQEGDAGAGGVPLLPGDPQEFPAPLPRCARASAVARTLAGPPQPWGRGPTRAYGGRFRTLDDGGDARDECGAPRAPRGSGGGGGGGRGGDTDTDTADADGGDADDEGGERGEASGSGSGRMEGVQGPGGGGGGVKAEAGAAARGARDDRGALDAEQVGAALARVRSDVATLCGRLQRCGLPAERTAAWREGVCSAGLGMRELLAVVLEAEKELNSVGDGQPEGASNEELAESIREVEDFEVEFVLPLLPGEDGDGDGAGGTGGDEADGGDVKGPQAGGQGAAGAGGAAPSSKAVDGGGGVAFRGSRRVPAAAAAHAPASGVEGEGARGDSGAAGAAGVVKTEDGDAAAEHTKPQSSFKLVCSLEELDDSEEENRQREKLSRAAAVMAALAEGVDASQLSHKPRFSLWRTRRDREVFLREVRRAQISCALPHVAYIAAMLVDRAEVLVAGLRLQRRAEAGDADAPGADADVDAEATEDEDATQDAPPPQRAQPPPAPAPGRQRQQAQAGGGGGSSGSGAGVSAGGREKRKRQPNAHYEGMYCAFDEDGTAVEVAEARARAEAAEVERAAATAAKRASMGLRGGPRVPPAPTCESCGGAATGGPESLVSCASDGCATLGHPDCVGAAPGSREWICQGCFAELEARAAEKAGGRGGRGAAGRKR